MNYRLTTIIAVITIYLSIGLCSAQTIRFTPQWTPQAQFAGFYAALENGFYKEAGLDVEINHTSAFSSSTTMLKEKKADIISLMLTDAIIFKAHDGDILNVGQFFHNSTMAIVSHKPLDGNIKRLEGCKIGAWKSGHATVAIAMLAKKSIYAEWILAHSTVNIFLSGSVDASVVTGYNELQVMRETGLKLPENQIIRLSDVGCNIPEDGIYTTRAYSKKHPEQIAKFREATQKGWEWVRDNKREAIDIVMKVARENNTPTNRYHQTKMLETILNRALDLDREPLLDEARYNNVLEILSLNKESREKVAYGDLVKNK